MKTFLHLRQVSPLFLTGCLLLSGFMAHGQYFGRNKVNYRQFDFKVLQTPHFDIHHYLTDTVFLNRLARQCEQWYQTHQQVFHDTFTTRNPIIFYNHHAHFQQTRTIPGLISPGTGGVTEALKNRVVMPFMESNAQTDHVLSHELVHAFQYHLIKNNDRLSLNNAFQNLPLWMVEGMAEYLSIGPADVQTAMWLRTAVQNDKLPTLKDLTNKPYDFFPYRWGHAFWAYVSGVGGDDIIVKLFTETALNGYAKAIQDVLGLSEKEFSEKWKEDLKTTYRQQLKTAALILPGKKLLDEKKAGSINVVPSLSPDGSLVAFWTEKDIFTFDLYIADAASGKLLRKITRHSLNTHIDEYSSYESAVAWSPDSREVAFVAFKQGENRLILANAHDGKINREYRLQSLDGFSHPAWSPDGKSMALTGMKNGQSDLYLLNLQSGELSPLTQDRYADLHPSFSPDGKWIVFATDRPMQPSGGNKPGRYSHSLAFLNLQTGEIKMTEIFPGANNLNPVFGNDNHVVYFLSDRDGFRNLYSYRTDNNDVMQLTRLQSGISGITLFAPAISIPSRTGYLLYTVFNGRGYDIYSVSQKDFIAEKVSARDVDFSAAQLPPQMRSENDFVQQNIRNMENNPVADSAFQEKPYRTRFQLDYIGNMGMGVSASRYGSGLAGGINGIFSDMLGYHQLYGVLVMNGQLMDVGGMAAYLNQKRRFNWGFSLSHIPYLSGYERLFFDTIVLRSDTLPVINHSIDLIRTFENRIAAVGMYPFSQTRRLEAGATLARYHYRRDRYTNYYYNNYLVAYGEQKKLPVPPGFNLGQAYVALVSDNSHFGGASPLTGHRYRLEVGSYFGEINTFTLLGDYRRYVRLHPFTLAGRSLYYGRFGKDAESGFLSPLYIGYPWLVRGYEPMRFTKESSTLNINNLLGSKMFIANAELRYPLLGPKRLAPLKSNSVYAELALFTDGGIAWGNGTAPGDDKNGLTERNPLFVMSSGVSMRINLFGYLVIEPHYAIPWQNGGWANRYFSINILPGW